MCAREVISFGVGSMQAEVKRSMKSSGRLRQRRFYAGGGQTADDDYFNGVAESVLCRRRSNVEHRIELLTGGVGSMQAEVKRLPSAFVPAPDSRFYAGGGQPIRSRKFLTLTASLCAVSRIGGCQAALAGVFVCR